MTHEVNIQYSKEIKTMNTTSEKQSFDIGIAEEADVERDRLVAEAMLDSRKLVTFRTIDAIDPIPGADFIKVASIEGWKVVVKHDEFQPGDMCVFFEVDSFLPMGDLQYEFLRKNATTWHGIEGARLKTIRLRKTLSQGLALPISAFPILQQVIEVAEREGATLRDINLTGILRIPKWEKVMSTQLAGLARGNFPSFLRKSDQERCQNIPNEIFGYEDEWFKLDTKNVPPEVVDVMVQRGEVKFFGQAPEMTGGWYKVRKASASRDTRYEISLKLDGSSMTVYCKGVDEDRVEGVCSRNLDLKLEGNEDNSFVQMAQNGILDVLCKSGTDVAIQGELMGPGIQGNREDLTHNQFFIYNIFDIKTNEFMTPPERLEWVRTANVVSKNLFSQAMLDHVFVLHESSTLAELGITNMDQLLKFAEGPSLKNQVREGLVFKAVDGKHQFKVISNQYLLNDK